MSHATPAIFSHIRLAVSACLLGEAVRYDGRHKRHPWIGDTLASRYTLIPLCPELTAGLGVPRPAIQLYGNPSAPQAREVARTDRDHSDALDRANQTLIPELEPVCGVILKARSPSCGPEGIPVHPQRPSNTAPPTAAGLFAAAVRAQLPLTPIIDEEALARPAQQAAFLTAIHLFHQWRTTPPATRCALTRFHQLHGVRATAHHPTTREQLEQLLNQADRSPYRHVANHYIQRLLTGLIQATRRGK